MDRKDFAVIGHPIGHTMSPFLHGRLFSVSGVSAAYRVFDIPPEGLAGSMPRLSALCGFNITIPHKRAIIPLLSGLDLRAELCGSVNTVKNESGRLTGYSTDGTGFRRALADAGAALTGRTVILGAGGAARAMAFEAVLCGGAVTIAARAHSLFAAERLCADLRKKVPGARADFCPLDGISGRADVLANATPAGMYPHPEGCPVSEEAVRNAAFVFDAVYNPNETALLRLARRNGIPAAGGMGMLVHQAAAAQEIWTGAEFGAGEIARLCADAVLELKKTFGNLVLCGFMGSGKTTVGKRLSTLTGRTFVDMDKQIEREQGVPIHEIFARRGEAAFRRLECEAAEKLGSRCGLIIATGGGTLMNPRAAAALKANGVVVLLDAPLPAVRARLAGDHSRPLLAGPDRDGTMERLYRERSSAYRAAADCSAAAGGSPDAVARGILDLLGQTEKPGSE